MSHLYILVSRKGAQATTAGATIPDALKCLKKKLLAIPLNEYLQKETVVIVIGAWFFTRNHERQKLETQDLIKNVIMELPYKEKCFVIYEGYDKGYNLEPLESEKEEMLGLSPVNQMRRIQDLGILRTKPGTETGGGGGGGEKIQKTSSSDESVQGGVISSSASGNLLSSSSDIETTNSKNNTNSDTTNNSDTINQQFNLNISANSYNVLNLNKTLKPPELPNPGLNSNRSNHNDQTVTNPGPLNLNLLNDKITVNKSNKVQSQNVQTQKEEPMWKKERLYVWDGWSESTKNKFEGRPQSRHVATRALGSSTGATRLPYSTWRRVDSGVELVHSGECCYMEPQHPTVIVAHMLTGLLTKAVTNHIGKDQVVLFSVNSSSGDHSSKKQLCKRAYVGGVEQQMEWIDEKGQTYGNEVDVARITLRSGPRNPFVIRLERKRNLDTIRKKQKNNRKKQRQQQQKSQQSSIDKKPDASINSKVDQKSKQNVITNNIIQTSMKSSTSTSNFKEKNASNVQNEKQILSSNNQNNKNKINSKETVLKFSPANRQKDSDKDKKNLSNSNTMEKQNSKNAKPQPKAINNNQKDNVTVMKLESRPKPGPKPKAKAQQDQKSKTETKMVKSPPSPAPAKKEEVTKKSGKEPVMKNTNSTTTTTMKELNKKNLTNSSNSNKEKSPGPKSESPKALISNKRGREESPKLKESNNNGTKKRKVEPMKSSLLIKENQIQREKSSGSAGEGSRGNSNVKKKNST